MGPPGRAGRAAMLAALVLIGCGSSPAAASRDDSGITGRALLGPTCPVQRPGQSCERGYETTIAVYTARNHRLVKRFRTAADGTFRVRVAPGRYSVRGTTTGPPHARPVAVTVRRHRLTRTTILFDTGMR